MLIKHGLQHEATSMTAAFRRPAKSRRPSSKVGGRGLQHSPLPHTTELTRTIQELG